MRSRHFLWACVGVALLAGIVLPARAQVVDYVLGPQDIFSITVWGPGGASERFTVETDETFTYPMLGRLKAGGLTARQLQDDLTNQLRDGFFNDPRITVQVEEYPSQRIFIVGEVRSPGTYTLKGPMTFVEALALAGAPTSNAGSVAFVRRRTNSGANSGPVTRAEEGIIDFRIDLSSVESGLLTNNPILRDGDTIAVPRVPPVFVYGHIGRPGEYVVGREATVRQLLSLAGGVTQRGAAGRIKIIRSTNGIEHEVKVTLDDRVQPGDTIVVPERFF